MAVEKSANPILNGYLAVQGWMRRLYDWVLHWADTPYGGPALFLLAFMESSFFPIPQSNDLFLKDYQNNPGLPSHERIRKAVLNPIQVEAAYLPPGVDQRRVPVVASHTPEIGRTEGADHVSDFIADKDGG